MGVWVSILVLLCLTLLFLLFEWTLKKLKSWNTNNLKLKKKQKKQCTFYVKDAVPQCASDGGERRLLRHVEEKLLSGWTGNRLDLLDQVLCVDVVPVVITQHLYEKDTKWKSEEEDAKRDTRVWTAARWLTAMPKRVMPFRSHSARTASLSSTSWDSPSVTTTITLAAPSRPPLTLSNPHWLRRAVTAGVKGVSKWNWHPSVAHSVTSIYPFPMISFCNIL